VGGVVVRLDRSSDPKTYRRISTAWERALIEQHEEERFRWTMVSLGAFILALIIWRVAL
jgi:hypothetical protein